MPALLITDAAVKRFDEIAERLRERARGAGVSLAEVEEYLSVNRRDLLAKIAEKMSLEAQAPIDVPEEWTPARRTERNLAAMRLLANKAPLAMTAEDRIVLSAYSGWGGLSLEKVKDQFPPSLEIDTEALIHEYYTPFDLCLEIAKASLPFLPEIAGVDGVIRAIEPSAGIGRFIRAYDALPSKPPIRWTAVELSSLAASLLRAARPGTEVEPSSFESWIGRNESRQYNLVIANPPFGERGAHAFEDPNRSYRESTAAGYFVRRGLDTLTVGGIGIFIIPAGYVSDARRKAWREKILLRHHLLAAYRLPSHVRTPDGRLRPLFPGTQNVTDVLFFRRRPGELEEVDAADLAIVAGDYFTEVPGHILGTVDQTAGQYKVIGPPVRLPTVLARPICETCRVRLVEPAPAAEETREIVDNPKLDAARALGSRVTRYLEAVAQRSDQAPALWPELHAALMDWARQFGSPFGASNLRELAGETEFLRAWDVQGRLIPSLQTAPNVDLGKLALLSDPVALAEYVWAQERGLTVARLLAVLSDQGREPSRQAVLERLYTAGWCVDGPGLQLLMPRAAYLSGNLWRRMEHLDAAPEHPRAAVQRELLREHIPPVLLTDLGDYSPRLGWIPADLIERFAVDALSASTMRLTRKQGFISPESIEYETIEPGDKDSPLTAEAIAFLGWLNHDLSVFKPKRKQGRSLLEEREERAQRWETGFRDWVAADPARTQAVVDAYTKKFRGYRKPTYSTDPLNLVRWTDDPKRQLYDYQRAGVRRIVENRGGILSYDVGVGKTFTALASIALLRQDGAVKRPIIVVPNSLIFQWLAEIKRVLPDYRVGLIGSKLVVRQRGARKNQTVSVNDTGLERASKWARFQGGEYDLVLLTYSALARTRLDIEAASEMFDRFGAVAREIRISRRAANRKDPDKLTEREEAIKEAKTAGWIQGRLEIPKNWEYDGDIVWDKLGCDFLVVDEFHNFKNLFMPDARERGLPAFMGSGGEGSDRAWQLFFRAAAVRRFTGGGGILGLTATPAKNGPTELFSAFAIIDPGIWAEFGISDAEQFIDQFCLLEPRPVVTTSMTIEVRDAMVGFQNLADLRSILERYIEFKSAREAAEGGKLKKPKAEALSVPLQQDEEQRRKLAEIMSKLRERVEIQLGTRPPPTEEVGEEGRAVVGLVEKSAAPDLGMIARLGLIAIHAQLDEGYTLDSAVEGGKGKEDKQLPPPRSFSSPKFNAVAERVVANAQCGHIVFIEPLAAQAWLREILVQRGIPRERIALLNAETAKSGTDRLKIATEFNEGKYLVVIANSVAGEGANLQRRTCAVHNVDIPWDPMTRRQRIGRADRQGNELATVTVFDYLVRNSGDGPRFHKLIGKGTWIEMIIQTRDDVSINPAAQISLSPVELLADLTNDPEESKRLLAEIEKKEDLRKKLQVRARIARVLRAVNERFRTAERTQDAELAAQLRADGARMLEDMEQFDPKIWPFLDLARRVAHEPIVVTETALPLWAGLRLDNGEEAWEVGRVDGGYAGLRQRGTYTWVKSSGSELTGKKFPLYEPADFTRPWRVENDGADLSDRIGYLSLDSFLDFKWSWASESFIRENWGRYEPLLREQFRRRGGHMIPAKSREGELYLAEDRAIASLTILSPGLDGWQEYIRLGPATDYTSKDLAEVASLWWDRVYPRRRGAPAASSKGASGGPPANDPALAELLSEFDPAEAEGLLPLHRKRRAVRESVGILLRQRGYQVSTAKGMQGGLTASLGSKRMTLPAKQLLSAEPPDSAASELEEAALEAVGDILTMVERERPVHKDVAFDVVLRNLERDPGFYDDAIKAARPPEPEPEPEPQPETPTRPIVSPRVQPTGNYRLHRVYHSKRSKMVSIVELGERVSEDEFGRLRDLARTHGGYWSRYARSGVPRGFMFDDEKGAKNFVAAASAPTAAATPAATTPGATTSGVRRGHAYQVAGRWYGDTALVDVLQTSGFRLEHVGMGDFLAVGTTGNVHIDRYTDEKKVPGQEGRLHNLRHSAGDTALESVLATLVDAGKIDLLGPFDGWPAAETQPGPAVLDETIRLLKTDFGVQTMLGGDSSRLLALTLARSQDGWPEGLAIARVMIHRNKEPEINQWDLQVGTFREHGKSVFDQQALKRTVLDKVKAAARAAMESPSPTGSGYTVAGVAYVDGRTIANLRRRYRVDDSVPGLVYADFAGTKLELTQISDSAGLPGEEGPLYRLRPTETLPALASAEILKDRGRFEDWPSTRGTK